MKAQIYVDKYRWVLRSQTGRLCQVSLYSLSSLSLHSLPCLIMEPDPVNVSPLLIGMIKVSRVTRKGLLLPVWFSISLLLWCSAGVQNIQWHSSEHLLTGTLMSIFSGKFCQCPKLTSRWFSSTSTYSFLFACQPWSIFPQQTPSEDIKKRNWLWSRRAFFQIFLYYIPCFSLDELTAPLYLPFPYPLEIAAANFLAPGFVEDNVSTDWGWGGGFRMIQTNYIHCVLLFLLLLHL